MLKNEPYKGLATIYDDIRPSYPEQLIQDIIEMTNLTQTSQLLEIGAGTGKATIQFAEKGYSINAIEIGEEMAEVWRSKCSTYTNTTIDVISFEEWNGNLKKYDVIYSAQAFHWIDPTIKYKKCYDLLNEHGYLVLFWYNPSQHILPKTIEIENKIDQIIKKYCIDYILPDNHKIINPVRFDDRKIEIENSHLFKLIEKREYQKETQNNPNQYLKVKKSIPAFSNLVNNLDVTIQNQIDHEIIDMINKNGGVVGTILNFSLYICQKL